MREPDVTVNNLGELITHSANLVKAFGRREVWWRGHGRTEWPLTPGVYREGRDWNYELNVSARFVMKAHTRYAQCPPEGDWAEWLFLMQHYRLPTRLLDWTESCLVAAFFAATDHPQQDGALWALDPMGLNERQAGTPRLFSPSGAVARPLTLPPFQQGAAQTDKTLAFITKEVDVRMLIQQSAFTIHGSIAPLDTLPGFDVFTRKFTVPVAAKMLIRDQLNALGFSPHTLFPDLEHLAGWLAGMRF